MRIHNRIKRSTRQYIMVAFICLSFIGGAAICTTILLTGQIKEEYKGLLKEAYDTLEKNQRSVYVAAADILAGDVITEDKLEKRREYSSQPQEIYFTADEIGKTALIDIITGTQVLQSMTTDNSILSELREMEYDVISINANVVNNDTVDIRIFFPNGENYVVLSKKIIKGYIPEAATCYLWLNEEEILRMSAAIVDAGLYGGTTLYVTKYIEPNIQEASVVNYTPSLAILSLLETDPNILARATQELNKEVRKQLENRLANSMAADVSTISWDVDPNIAVAPTTSPENAPAVSQPDTAADDELGSSGQSADYFYYAEEEQAMERDVEYGE